MLDDVQALLDLAAQSLRVQTLACTPSPHSFLLDPGVCLVAVAFREPGKFPRIRSDPPLETVAAPGRGCRLPPRISGLPTVWPLPHALGTRVALLNGEEG
jgi:hypothetical protein